MGGLAASFGRSFVVPLALIAEAAPRGVVELIRVSCDDTVVGILYNFIYRGQMLAYQVVSHTKCGNLMHDLASSAITNDLSCLGRSLEVYDFLAGDDRYKRSLADGSHPQTWRRPGHAGRLACCFDAGSESSVRPNLRPARWPRSLPAVDLSAPVPPVGGG